MDKVIDGIYPQTNYTTQQFYTKEEYEKLQQENERLSDSAYRQADYDYRLDDAEEKIEMLEQENKQLKKSIDRIMQNKEIKTIDSEISLLNAELQQQNKRLIARLRPLEDSYFNGLSSIGIAELAKKSIRITAENRKLEYCLQEIREIARNEVETRMLFSDKKSFCDFNNILTKINEVIGAEE